MSVPQVVLSRYVLSGGSRGGSVGSMDPPFSSQLIIIHPKCKAIINLNFPGRILRPSCASYKLVNSAYAILRVPSNVPEQSSSGDDA